MDFWNRLFQGLVVQNMVGTSFGWPWSKAKNEKVSIPIPTQSLIHGFFRFLRTKQKNSQFFKTIVGLVSSYVLVSLHKEYEEAFTVIKVIFSLYL
jgi:hypothetical protein